MEKVLDIIDQEVARLKEPSVPSQQEIVRERLANPSEMTERLRICAKLFSIFPDRRDPEMSAEGYRESTLEIPVYWLSCTCDYIKKHHDPSTNKPWKWLPTVPELFNTFALIYRQYRRRISGRADYNTHGSESLDMDLELRLANALEPPWIGPGAPLPKQVE